MKTRERDIAAEILTATDDLVNTIRAKAAEFAAGEADEGRKRVKVREAWAVRLTPHKPTCEQWWVAADYIDALERYTKYRDGRWLFCTRARAHAVARHEREVGRCKTATVVRVAFYEVRRGCSQTRPAPRAAAEEGPKP